MLQKSCCILKRTSLVKICEQTLLFSANLVVFFCNSKTLNQEKKLEQKNTRNENKLERKMTKIKIRLTILYRTE